MEVKISDIDTADIVKASKAREKSIENRINVIEGEINSLKEELDQKVFERISNGHLDCSLFKDSFFDKYNNNYEYFNLIVNTLNRLMNFYKLQGYECNFYICGKTNVPIDCPMTYEKMLKSKNLSISISW